MCGICFSTDETRIQKMVAAMSHRGLPGRSHIKSITSKAHLGHVRLPIQGPDESNDQPYSKHPWHMSFAGELFNYKQFDPKATCDTPIIYKHLTQNNMAAIQKWDGFWSILLYNSHSKILYIYVDHLAKKPLYYNVATGDVASEIKALCIGQKPIENKYYYSQIAKFGYPLSGQQTFDGNIIKIGPGTCWIINTQTNTVLGYNSMWSLIPDQNPSTNLGDKLEQAVKNRMVSDVPVSLLLSGGLDSSMIYHYMEKLTHDFTIFHIDNDEAQFLGYLKIPSDIRISPLSINPDDSLDTILYFNESPVDLGSMLQQYALARSIRDHNISVAISGDGADEVFGGYTRTETYDSQYSDIYDELVNYHHPRLDKLMMAHTIELRSPFLAPNVVNHGLSLPYEQRIRKSGLKELARAIGLPDQIIDRPKVPLKSAPVLRDPIQWRFHLIEKFKEVSKLYYEL
jgi:asparagine synthase (glutamine-hydrolysing)